MLKNSRFYNGKDSEIENVKIKIDNKKIIGISDSEFTLFVWSLEDLNIIYLHPDFLEAKISSKSDDKARLVLCLNDLNLLKTLHPQLIYPKNNILKNTGFLIPIIIVVIFLIVAFVRNVNNFVEYVASYIPPEVENKIGDMALKSIISDEKICKNPKSIAVFNKILSKLEKNNDISMKNYKFFTIKEKTKNAAALPGKNIIIFSPLITNSHTAEEILSVVAHEIGHVELNHNKKKIIRDYSFQLFDIIMSGSISTMSVTLTNLSFSRKDELEADQYAIKILNNSKIDPKGLIDFLMGYNYKIDQLEKNDSNKNTSYLSFFSTHPDSEYRSKIVNKNRLENSHYNKSIISKKDFDILKNICQ